MLETIASPGSLMMARPKPSWRSTHWIAVAALAVLLPGAAAAQAQTPAQPAACIIPDAEARFQLPLLRTARRMTAGLPLTIVAVGSSSTSGAGASSARATYPSRLESYLSEAFPDRKFVVHNRGVSGDTAGPMLKRFDNDVLAAKPDLVLWQAGTNSLLSDYPLAPHFSMLEAGLARLKAANIDAVLIDPQYAPRVIAKPLTKEMIALMSRAAKTSGVNVFHRFAVMQHWHEVAGIPFNTFLSPDELHMNDWSYACVARGLAGAITEAATRPAVSTAVTAKAKQ